MLSSTGTAPTALAAPNRVPDVTVEFWLIKLLAVTMGETAADYLAVNLGLGLTVTSLIMTGILVVRRGWASPVLCRRLWALLAHDLHGLGEEVVGALVVIGIAAFDALGLEIGHFGLVGGAQRRRGFRSAQVLERVFARHRSGSG